jgi:trehalose 6-phosphate synthase
VLESTLAGEDDLWITARVRDQAAPDAHGDGIQRLQTPEGTIRHQHLLVEPQHYEAYYNAVANRVLWFVQHYLFDVTTRPSFDRDFYQAWQDYVTVNDSFAAACARRLNRRGLAFVQDYHLTLVPGQLRRRRPDVPISFFVYCPWSDPTYFSILPPAIRSSIVAGMLGADLVGFLSPRWAANFLRCCEAAGYPVDHAGGTVTVEGTRAVHVRHYPVGVDEGGLRARSATPEVRRHRERLSRLRERGTLVVRVDRMEPSKNIVRGLESFGLFLEEHPEARGRTTHLVHAYGSRSDLPEYRAYAAEVRRRTDAINHRHGTERWQPVQLHLEDDGAFALAAMSLADVLVVNPVWDGMNLVAKEGPLVSEHGAALVLSCNAGAAGDLGEAALLVNPFDVAELADAIAVASAMPLEERSRRLRQLRRRAAALPPKDWFAAQNADLLRLTGMGAGAS